jgi:hypothetical protein
VNAVSFTYCSHICVGLVLKLYSFFVLIQGDGGSEKEVEVEVEVESDGKWDRLLTRFSCLMIIFMSCKFWIWFSLVVLAFWCRHQEFSEEQYGFFVVGHHVYFFLKC